MNPITKKIQKRDEYFVQFTEEETAELGIQGGDKFEVIPTNDGILLRKFQTIELDFSEFERSTLEYLIGESVKEDISISEVITNVLKRMLVNP
jgi:hypothetical protein